MRCYPIEGNGNEYMVSVRLSSVNFYGHKSPDVDLVSVYLTQATGKLKTVASVTALFIKKEKRLKFEHEDHDILESFGVDSYYISEVIKSEELKIIGYEKEKV